MPAIDIERDVPNAALLYSGGKAIHQPFVAQREATWDPKWREFRIYVDLMMRKGGEGAYLRYSTDDSVELIDEALKADTGRTRKLPPRRIEERVPILKSRYGIYWRGIQRPQDREMGIAGGEIVVIDLATNEILGYRRGFVLAWESADKQAITWGSQATCPERFAVSISDLFVKKVLKPRPRRELQRENKHMDANKMMHFNSEANYAGNGAGFDYRVMGRRGWASNSAPTACANEVWMRRVA